MSAEFTVTQHTHTAQWSYGSISFQTELMVEIYSESLVRANGKVFLMKFKFS